MITLRTRVGGWLLVVHLLVVAAAVPWLAAQPLWVLPFELLLLASLLICWRLVRLLDTPRELASLGADLLGDGDVTTRFRAVGQPDLDALIKVYNRMSEALASERRRLEEQNLFLERLITASPGGVIIFDHHQRVSHANPAAERLLALLAPQSTPTVSQLGPHALDGRDLDSLAGGRLRDLVHPGAEPQLLSLTGGRRIRAVPGQFTDRGHPRPFLLLEELTEELRASERAAWERLVRLVAHEVNNSVGAVRSLLDTLGTQSARLPVNDRASTDEAFAVASDRLAHLAKFVDGYVAVVRLPPPNRRPTDLVALIDRLLLLSAAEAAARGVTLAWQNRPDQPELVDVDVAQLEQALLNVLRNAVDASATAPSGAGMVTISLDKAEGGELVLRVRDSGPGISPEVAAKLFLPFFTTKRDGRGIGLTLVAEVLDAHQLRYSLSNASDDGDGFGAVFTIRFRPG